MPIYESKSHDLSARGMSIMARSAFAHNLAVVCCAAIDDGFRLVRLTGNRYELRVRNDDGSIDGASFLVDPRGCFIRAHPLNKPGTTYRTVRKMRLSLKLSADRI